MSLDLNFVDTQREESIPYLSEPLTKLYAFMPASNLESLYDHLVGSIKESGRDKDLLDRCNGLRKAWDYQFGFLVLRERKKDEVDTIGKMSNIDILIAAIEYAQTNPEEDLDRILEVRSRVVNAFEAVGYSLVDRF